MEKMILEDNLGYYLIIIAKLFSILLAQLFLLTYYLERFLLTVFHHTHIN